MLPNLVRSFLRFNAENPVSDAKDFSRLYFKVNAPTSEAILRNCFVVLPLRFRFKTRDGKTVSNRKIALKPFPERPKQCTHLLSPATTRRSIRFVGKFLRANLSHVSCSDYVLHHRIQRVCIHLQPMPLGNSWHCQPGK